MRALFVFQNFNKRQRIALRAGNPEPAAAYNNQGATGSENIMKWYKHLAKSIDNPFVRQLMYEFGADAYLVFFGTLEIYADNFSPESDWKLTINLRYFHEKFLLSKSKIKNVLLKITEWEVTFNNDDVVIFIPKFKELLDNYTKDTNPKNKNKLASDLQETFQPIKNKDKRIKNKEGEKEITPIIPYEGIVEYLNQKTGKNFDHTVKEIRAKIKARSRNGKRTIEDFKRVIDNKCNQWIDDEKMMQFLRPETLFGTKFESYLNETIHPLAGKFSDKTLANIKMFETWRPPNER
jgi:uncharacterized phage protein (TIGR02220 family)